MDSQSRILGRRCGVLRITARWTRLCAGDDSGLHSCRRTSPRGARLRDGFCAIPGKICALCSPEAKSSVAFCRHIRAEVKVLYVPAKLDYESHENPFRRGHCCWSRPSRQPHTPRIQLVLHVDSQILVPAYEGSVWVDSSTARVRRIE